MDATIYNLQDARSARNSHMLMERCSPMQLASDGLATMTSATLFWVQYGEAMASFHRHLAYQFYSPDLK
jgi:hypothetical protein